MTRPCWMLNEKILRSRVPMLLRWQAPPGIAAVIAVCHYKARLVFEVARQIPKQSLDRRRAGRDLRIVLAIVGTKEAIDGARIAVDKDTLDPREDQRLVGFG